MKKFSTATLILALAALTAAPAFADSKKKCALRSDAPEKHTVVKGDTLWGISSKFLDHPWCWPKVWGMNQEQIRNPHWIFPGQVIYIDPATGKLRLASPTGATAKAPHVAPSGVQGDARLSPKMHTQQLDKEPLSSIDPKVIEPFLSRPLIVETHELESSPYIVAAIEGRVKMGQGDRAYVRGDLKNHSVFNVFSPAAPLKDPETGKVIALEAEYLGTVDLVRQSTAKNEAHAFVVQEAAKEMAAGDRLLPKPPHTVVNYVPHPPAQPVNARVVSIYGGVSHAGQNQIITINRGTNHGLDVGAVLKLYRLGDTVPDKTAGLFSHSAVKLPDEDSGTLFVFRVFKNISYALIMEARDVVVVGDTVRSPD